MEDLVDQFVAVRLVKANDLDLTLFQFDYDLTFAVFFMNADLTLYGRYGTRSEREDATSEMSLAGLAEAMQAALQLHKRYPDNKSFLSGKQSVATKYERPNDFPSLRGEYELNLDYEADVAQSCLHCHQIREAEREVHRVAGEPIPDQILFPYPNPDILGIELNPDRRATIAKVTEGSIAARAGLEAGDSIGTLDGQAILSQADVEWVLHHADGKEQLAVIFRRGDEGKSATLSLPAGWRKNTDISWRVSSWALRRMGTGGMLLEEATPEQRRAAGVQNGELALHVKHVGKYGAHAAAHRAGVRQGDILISFDNQTSRMTDSQLLAYAAQHTKPGDAVPVTLVRDGKPVKLKIPMQE